MLITSRNPIDFWYVKGIPVAIILGGLATIGSLAIIANPRSHRAVSLAGLPLLYWALRAIDATWDVAHGTREAASIVIHITFVIVLYSYWSIAIRYETLAAALRKSLLDHEPTAGASATNAGRHGDVH